MTAENFNVAIYFSFWGYMILSLAKREKRK